MSSPNISVSPAHAIGARKGTEYVRRAPRGAEQVMVPFPDAWLRSRATRVRRLSPGPDDGDHGPQNVEPHTQGRYLRDRPGPRDGAPPARRAGWPVKHVSTGRPGCSVFVTALPGHRGSAWLESDHPWRSMC
jgi:hypothetical protein